MKKPLKRYSKKTADKRKEERKDFPEFFQRHIEIIKDNRLCCEECGCRLIGDVSEVAHVLPKGYFKSISTNDENVLYLCGWKSGECHNRFDNGSNEAVKQMNIFPKVAEVFQKLKLTITENINYKTVDRYTYETND